MSRHDVASIRIASLIRKMLRSDVADWVGH